MAKPSSSASEPEESESFEEALAKLTPEQTEMFMRALTMTMKKRRLMLIGNLLSLFCLLGGLLLAFNLYAAREPNSFMAWIFLTPFAAAGLCLTLFGRLAKSAGFQASEPAGAIDG